MNNPLVEKFGFWIYKEKNLTPTISKKIEEMNEKNIGKICYWAVIDGLYFPVKRMVDTKFWQPINEEVIN